MELEKEYSGTIEDKLSEKQTRDSLHKSPSGHKRKTHERSNTENSQKTAPKNKDTSSEEGEVISLKRQRRRNIRKPSYDEEALDGRYGKWTPEEHARLLKALELFGNSWSHVARLVGSRSKAQIRSHVQKYFLKVKKDTIQELARTDKLKDKLFVVTREYRNCALDPMPLFLDVPATKKRDILQQTNETSPASIQKSLCSSLDPEEVLLPGTLAMCVGYQEASPCNLNKRAKYEASMDKCTMSEEDYKELCGCFVRPEVEIETLTVEKNGEVEESYSGAAQVGDLGPDEVLNDLLDQ